MKKGIIVDIASSLFIILFFYTGIFKLWHLDHFKAALHKSPVLDKYQEFVGITIPSLEVLIGLALFLPYFFSWPRIRKWGLYSYTVLMAIFTLYVWGMLRFARELPCTCGGIITKMNWHQHFYFNTTFTILGLIAIWLNNRQFKQSQKSFSMA